MFTWASKKLFGCADERHVEAASLEVLGDDLQAESLGRVGQLENGNIEKKGHAPRNRFGVAPTGLLDDERRDEQLEVALPGPPPVFRDLLMPGHDEVPRRTRGEVADDGRLEVDASGHAAMLALRDTRRPAEWPGPLPRGRARGSACEPARPGAAARVRDGRPGTGREDTNPSEPDRGLTGTRQRPSPASACQTLFGYWHEPCEARHNGMGGPPGVPTAAAPDRALGTPPGSATGGRRERRSPRRPRRTTLPRRSPPPHRLSPARPRSRRFSGLWPTRRSGLTFPGEPGAGHGYHSSGRSDVGR